MTENCIISCCLTMSNKSIYFPATEEANNFLNVSWCLTENYMPTEMETTLCSKEQKVSKMTESKKKKN